MNECIARDDLTAKHGTILTGGLTTETSIPGVFAGGDCVSGPDIAINAIGAGKRAALEIDEYLRTGKCTPGVELFNCTKGDWSEIPSDEFRRVGFVERMDIPVLPPEERKESFEESTRTWDERSAMDEAARCLSCGCTERYSCTLRRYASEYGVQFDHPCRHFNLADGLGINPGLALGLGLMRDLLKVQDADLCIPVTETQGPSHDRPRLWLA